MRTIDGKTYVAPSDVVEYLYCPRFIYFMHCLDLEQNEESRDKVMLGRKIHRQKEVQNPNYKRKRLGVTEKQTNVRLVSHEHGIHGIVDEVLSRENGTMSPLDYKFSEYPGHVYNTYRYQAVLYSLMVEEQFDSTVETAYISYVRSKNKIVDLKVTQSVREEALKAVDRTREIVNRGVFPEPTSVSKRCIDCTYNSICVGSEVTL